MKYQQVFEWLEVEVDKLGIEAPPMNPIQKPQEAVPVQVQEQEEEQAEEDEKVEIVGGEPESSVKEEPKSAAPEPVAVQIMSAPETVVEEREPIKEVAAAQDSDNEQAEEKPELTEQPI